MLNCLRTLCAILTLTLLSSVVAFAGPALCPAPTMLNTDYPVFGTFFGACGTVEYGPTQIVTAVPDGAEFGNVQSWLGFSPGPEGLYASASLFPEFALTEPMNVVFDWQAEVDPGVSGYMFAAIDGATVWDYSFFGLLPGVAFGNMTMSGGSASLDIGAGNYSLAFGVVTTGYELIICPFGECIVCLDPDCILEPPVDDDPILTITNLGVQAIPEPSTIALLGLGLGTIAFFRRRRRG